MDKKTTPAWLAEQFRDEELAGHALATKVRIVALTVVAATIYFITEPPDSYIYIGILVLFAIAGLISYSADRAGAPVWVRYAFIAADFIGLTVTFTMVFPALNQDWPPQMALRGGVFLYFLLLLVQVAFTYSWRRMAWAGVAAATSWSAGLAWLMKSDGVVTRLDHFPGMTPAEELAQHLDPNWIDLNTWVQQVVVLLLIASALAAVVHRSRRLNTGQVAAARERANLARYFSPNMVEALAGRDQPVGATQRQDVAVLFADMVGFTTMAEAMEPEEVMDLLRDFHGRMEDQVFQHNGTLEKFIGDAMLATFGTPEKGSRDALDALDCMRGMIASLEHWNAERADAGLDPIKMGIGIHYGPAVFGDIGSERNMAFAVIGDTVNTASRLQSLTRDLSCAAVVSDSTVEAAHAETAATKSKSGAVARLRKAPEQHLRGRQEPVEVWTFDNVHDVVQGARR
jgi:adenylate cyclase